MHSVTPTRGRGRMVLAAIAAGTVVLALLALWPAAAHADNGNGTGGIPAVQEQIAELAAHLDARLDTIETAAQSQSDGFGAALDAQTTRLEAKIAELERQNAELRTALDSRADGLAAGAAALSAELDALSSTVGVEFDSAKALTKGLLKEIGAVESSLAAYRSQWRKSTTEDPYALTINTCASIGGGVSSAAELGGSGGAILEGEVGANVFGNGGTVKLEAAGNAGGKFEAGGGVDVTTTACMQGVTIPNDSALSDAQSLYVEGLTTAGGLMQTGILGATDAAGLGPLAIAGAVEILTETNLEPLFQEGPTAMFSPSAPSQAIAESLRGLPLGDLLDVASLRPESNVELAKVCERALDLGPSVQQICANTETDIEQTIMDINDTLDTAQEDIETIVDTVETVVAPRLDGIATSLGLPTGATVFNTLNTLALGIEEDVVEGLTDVIGLAPSGMTVYESLHEFATFNHNMTFDSLSLLHDGVGAVDEVVRDADAKIGVVQTNFDAIPGQIETALEPLETAVGGITTMVDGIDETVTGISGTANTINGAISGTNGLASGVATIGTTVGGINTTVTGINTAVGGITTAVGVGAPVKLFEHVNQINTVVTGVQLNLSAVVTLICSISPDC